VLSHTSRRKYGVCERKARPTGKLSGSRTEQGRDSRKLRKENLVVFYRVFEAHFREINCTGLVPWIGGLTDTYQFKILLRVPGENRPSKRARH
jgi:hypothetical protein